MYKNGIPAEYLARQTLNAGANKQLTGPNATSRGSRHLESKADLQARNPFCSVSLGQLKETEIESARGAGLLLIDPPVSLCS